ncbi:suppressor of cytokine signaling 2-like [Anthonomus grandis grandis]|uniref:suppressor of cytokine signaling 2-like n=1 Tax=Anthonomus grandis grandis TaxID=2921223 RepID=UPI00216521B8|nr:suppressor of cytokine signaling 2-like [Anthonomus grandis grandis]XP_050311300.1 suppressor of cytokine signaling 2-like [Anthonomus grandis grandis]
MRSCSQSTVCPKCKHEFTCCADSRRSLVLSGGGLVRRPDFPEEPAPPAVVNSSASSSLATNQPLAPPNACLSPQVGLVSPSVPLSFGYPEELPLQLLPTPHAANQDAVLQQLRENDRALRQSGWFYEGITFEESHEMLKSAKVGTFLVRNSSDPKYLYSLSVQTERGPTSVRLHYTNGYFKLDAQAHLQHVMPAFTSVIDLIQHYVQAFKRYQQRDKNTQVWVDNQGKWYSPIVIQRPLIQETASLKHLARLAIHRSIRTRPASPSTPQYRQLELPCSLESYLEEYPHSI